MSAKGLGISGISQPNLDRPVASRPKLSVGFVLAPRFTLTAFASFIDAIRLAADEGDRSRQIECRWAVLGEPGKMIESSCGLRVQPWDEMMEPNRFDYIVVVGGLLHGHQDVVLGTYGFLQLAARQGVPLIGLCTGSFILARAGLLKGYEACVSWFHKEEFEAEFPDIRVQSNNMFIVDRDRMTCAGGTSVVHLASQLIESHCGRAQALKSLRILIEEQPLPAKAWQPEAIMTRQAQDEVVRRAMHLIEQNLSDQISVADLSRALGVSVRQLERRFLADAGITALDYKLRLRLARAKWLVEHTGRTMTQIALDCGFSDASHFCRTFKRHYTTLPSQLRNEARIRDA